MASDKYSEERERELLMKAKQGDLMARRQLHREYRGLLDKLVYQNFSYSPQPISAIRTEAEALLDKCIDAWDPSVPNKPSTFIQASIGQKLKRYVNNNKSAIRSTENYAWKISKFQDSVEELMGELKRDPTDNEILDFMNTKYPNYNLSLKDLDRIRKEIRPTTLTSTIVGQSDENATMTVRDVMYTTTQDPMKQYALTLKARELNERINKMQEPHKSVLEYHLGINGKPQLSLRDISVKMGMNKYRVQVVLNEAKEMLS